MPAREPKWKSNAKVQERIRIGERRILRVLATYTVSTARTLEQKIADAGPGDQRVEPIYLTEARKRLERSGKVAVTTAGRTKTPWYHLSSADPNELSDRLNILVPIHDAVSDNAFTQRIGQALEIAVLKTMAESNYRYFGDFRDLHEHDDATLYSKQEPPTNLGRRKTSAPVDFLLAFETETLAIEVKNVRPWLYPDSEELKGLLKKAVELDAIPVLVARRIPYVTFAEILRPCGVIAHQVYNQRYPASGANLAAQAAHKDNLGYHDVRASNEPDDRLRTFFHTNLPRLVADARSNFDANKDLLLALADGELNYATFHTQLRTRLGIYGPREED